MAAHMLIAKEGTSHAETAQAPVRYQTAEKSCHSLGVAQGNAPSICSRSRDRDTPRKMLGLAKPSVNTKVPSSRLGKLLKSIMRCVFLLVERSSVPDWALPSQTGVAGERIHVSRVPCQGPRGVDCRLVR
jgi:hypothetical protein